MGRKPIVPEGPSYVGSDYRSYKYSKWLMSIPDRARELRLIWRDGDGNETVLQSWLREVVTPEDTSTQIAAAIQEHADEMQQHCRGSIVWVDDHGSVVTTKPWRANPHGEEQTFTGDTQSMLQQNQRHIEALVQYNVRTQSMVVEQMTRVIDLLTHKYEDTNEVAEVREAQIEALREELRQLREQSSDKEPDPTTERVVRVLEGALAQGLAKRGGS